MLIRFIRDPMTEEAFANNAKWEDQIYSETDSFREKNNDQEDVAN